MAGTSRRGVRTRLPFVLYTQNFTDRCFVDKDVLHAQEAGILRGMFKNEHGEQVVVHVPTRQFFELHRLNPDDMEIWDHMNLRGYFELPAWGPDFMRAYQALTTWTEGNRFTVTNLAGEPTQYQINRMNVREALNLPSGESIDYFKLRHSDEDNQGCSDADRPVWDELKRQRVRLALQLHMQHFHMTYPHRWTKPKKVIATEYSLRDIRGKGVKYDYAHYLLFEFERGKKSIDVARASKAKRPQPIYLGGVLVLTRIVYHAMGALDRLPEPIEIPQGVMPKHTTRVFPTDHPPKAKKRPQPKVGPSQRTTRTQREAPKEPTPEGEEDYLLELAKALSLSLEGERLGKGDEQELKDLAQAIQRSTEEVTIRQAHAQGQERPPPQVYPPNFRAQMELVRILINQLNQDSSAVQRIALVVDHYNERLRRIEKAKEEEERQALERLRQERLAVAEAARQDRGKGKEGSPSKKESKPREETPLESPERFLSPPPLSP